MRSHPFVLLFVTILGAATVQAELTTASVEDSSGAPIANARWQLSSSLGTVLATGSADGEGSFRVDVPPGTYTLSVDAPGFARSMQVLASSSPSPVRIRLHIAPTQTSVTVSSDRGVGQEITRAAPFVHSVSSAALQMQGLPTLGNALAGLPGVLVQQTTYGQVSPFLRGLTGYHVLNLYDGVRFNNSTFRSGPNQYLAFFDAGATDGVEVMLGPAGSLYGSDALGGVIQMLSPQVAFAANDRFEPHLRWQAFGATADLSAGTRALASVATERWYVAAGGSARKHNDLRAGGGSDSRNVYRRLFGLSGEQVRSLTGGRLQDSGFAQTTVQAKVATRITEMSSLSAVYLRSELHDVRAYNSLLGGLGRLQATFDPQVLDLFYARYERLALGAFDSLAATFSINSQRDGSVRQGLRTADAVTIDDNQVDAFGYTAQSRVRQIVFGGEYYAEGIESTRLERNIPRRPLYPDDSKYRTASAFVQHAFETGHRRLRVQSGARFTRVGYKTSEQPAFGIARSDQVFSDATVHASAVWQFNSAFAAQALVGRGFRAPNSNDLGAVGLNDLGYEVPSRDAVDAGALLSNGAGESALSLGRPVESLRSERLWNYEVGMRYVRDGVYIRAHAFQFDLFDPIVRRTLLFPLNAAPSELAGIAVRPVPQTPAQAAQGVVGVATSIDPRAVKSFVNDGRSRYYGIDTLAQATVARRYVLEGSYSYLVGRDLNPNRHARRLPPQSGRAAVRYVPARRWWAEVSATFAGAQERLSGGDLDDERIGASRSLSDIASFFNGSRVQPFVDARGVFTPTAETLAQVQSRVLPRVTSPTARVPLYDRTPGWFDLALRGGTQIGEHTALGWAATNVLDRNYRVHGSGVDAPGISAFVSLTVTY